MRTGESKPQLDNSGRQNFEWQQRSYPVRIQLETPLTRAEYYRSVARGRDRGEQYTGVVVENGTDLNARHLVGKAVAVRVMRCVPYFDGVGVHEGTEQVIADTSALIEVQS